MRKTNKYIICTTLIAMIGLSLYLPTTHAQGTLIEKIRARRLEKNQAAKEGKVQDLYEKYEEECIADGWRTMTVNVNGLERRILWKAPKGNWRNGAIIALHGGGGTYSNYCANIDLGKPMIDFSELAISEGFAVISLDSEDGLMKDTNGLSCGKRWLFVEADKANPDLLLIERVITETIPQLRPANSAKSIFITGISNGGFMTVLAGTHFGDKISAFAPVSAGDPYGTYVDCTEVPLRDTPGKFIDSETNKPINEIAACKADSYPHEKQWTVTGYQTPFKLFYHEGDAVVDTSCKEKAQRLLVEHGYQDEGSFVIENVGIKRIINHFWREEYNQPLIEFFKKYSSRTQNISQSNPRSDDYEFSLMHDGLTRTYNVHVSNKYDGKSPIPLLLAFHGYLGQGENMKRLTLSGFDKLSDSESFIVVYPDGIEKSWNVGQGNIPAANLNIDDVGFTKALIEDLKGRFNIDSKRVYATGMSNGAYFCNRLGCELSDMIVAVAPVAGEMPKVIAPGCSPARPVPVIIFHGTKDPYALYDGGKSGRGIFIFSAEDTARFWAEKNSCDPSPMVKNFPDTVKDGTTVTQILYTHCKQNADVILYKINNGGHAWPGGWQYLPKILVGKTAQDINATEIIWEFFKRHSKK